MLAPFALLLRIFTYRDSISFNNFCDFQTFHFLSLLLNVSTFSAHVGTMRRSIIFRYASQHLMQITNNYPNNTFYYNLVLTLLFPGLDFLCAVLPTEEMSLASNAIIFFARDARKRKDGTEAYSWLHHIKYHVKCQPYESIFKFWNKPKFTSSQCVQSCKFMLLSNWEKHDFWTILPTNNYVLRARWRDVVEEEIIGVSSFSYNFSEVGEKKNIVNMTLISYFAAYFIG